MDTIVKNAFVYYLYNVLPFVIGRNPKCQEMKKKKKIPNEKKKLKGKSELVRNYSSNIAQ